MTTPFTQIQLRNGTFQEWYDANPILALGEPGFEINTGKLKIGDGVKRWNNLDYMSCCPKTSPTPTPTAPGVNTIFVSWEDCYGGGSIDQIPNKFGHFDLCGLPCPISKDVRFYFQNNLEELHKRTKDLTPYNENYNYTCDTVDGNDTIVIRVEKGTGLKLELNNLVECTKPKPICNCSCCPVTPTPTPAIPDCLSYGGVKIVLSACHGCNIAQYNLYVGSLTESVWDDSQEILIEEINLNSSAGPNVVTESPYPCDGANTCCISNCGGTLSVQEVIIPSETIAELPLIPSETNCITIPVKLKCLLNNCHSNVTQYLAFSEGGCCVGSGTLDSQIDTGSGVGVQTITICCGACPTPTPTVTDDNIWGGTGCVSGVVYDVSADKKYRLYTEEELSTLTPADNISVKQFNIPARDWSAGFPGSPSLQEWFQINFTGNLEVVTSGDYNIRVLSDDGAKLWIDGVLIIDNDGVHNPESKNQNINLSSGIHSIRLDYFQGPKWQIALVVYWTPPGGSEVVIPISSFVCGCESSCSNNLISDGGFHSLTNTSFATGVFGSWLMQNVDIADVNNIAPVNPNDPYNSNLWVDLNACPNQGWIQQTINTTPGLSYTLSFNLGANPHGEIGTLRTMEAIILNDSSAVIGQENFEVSSTGATNVYSDMNWVRKNLTFLATSSQTTIKLASTMGSTCYGPIVDCVEVCENPTPPATPTATPTPTINSCNLSSWSWWIGSNGGGAGQKIQGLSSGAVRSSSVNVDGIFNTFWLRSSSGLKGVDFATPLTANGTANYGGTHPPEGNNIPFQIGEVVEVSGFTNVVSGSGAVAIMNGSYYVSDINVDNFDLVFSCTPFVSSTPTPTPTPTATPTPTPYQPGLNTANYYRAAIWGDSIYSNVTTVGSNGGPSRYGTFDQSGNLYQWNDNIVFPSTNKPMARGGSWNDADRYVTDPEFNGKIADGSFFLSSSFRSTFQTGPVSFPSDKRPSLGFRVASRFNPNSLSNFVLVDDVNNVDDIILPGIPPHYPDNTSGYGGVSYRYFINKYLVTNCEYAEFLNSVAKTDTYDLYMMSAYPEYLAITRSGNSGGYIYTVKPNYDDKPVVYVSWFCCARYCNWLHNGKPIGYQNIFTTEDGAYALNGRIYGDGDPAFNAVIKKVAAKYHIPTEDEWYKAAYYNGGGVYWKYATQSNEAPVAIEANSFGDGPVNSSYFCPVITTPTPTPTPASAGAGCWRGITASNDSSSLAAVTNTNKIYTSVDGGFNWIEREIPSTITVDITSSDDGTKLALLDRGGKIYISSDSGVSWTARESNRLWVSIASSGDGAKLIAIVQDGQIYTSDNSGVSWTARENNRDWVSVSSSSDGVKLVAADGDYTDSQIYTSSDSGASWTARVSGWWESATGTADGVKLAAITKSGDVYVSTNSGVDWTQKSNVYGNPRFIKYSGDGSKLIVGTFGLGLNNGQIYISINDGESWSLKLDQVGGINKAASSYDGSILSICECSGYIRISSDGGLTWGAR
jgi:formylglycine-generating enzyme required for sulfatase activity